MRLYIYGAGIMAYGAYKAIRELFCVTPEGFLVTDKKGQPVQIGGIPVYLIEECVDSLSDSLILIATPEEYQASIEQELIKRHLFHYQKIDSHVEYKLMGSYLKRAIGISLIEDYQAEKLTDEENEACVYMAVSHKDKKMDRNYKEEAWVKKIQVGAALTGVRIAEITDEGAESLSGENALYGELTASYYAWKHNKQKITGLFHYRRVLHITQKQLSLLSAGIIDVVLPLPFVCIPDASGQYGRYLLPEDIDVMTKVLKEHEPEENRSFLTLLKTPYLYNYNILIARKEVFDHYCGWLFSLLEEIKNRCEQTERQRMPRYIGRIGEVLTSLYFMRNERNWKIAHAEKIWRV